MPFNVELRDEHGATIDSVIGVRRLAELVPPLDDRSSAVLRFIDPYGDTVINRLQAGALVAELRARLARVQSSDGDRDAVAKVIDLAERCASGMHLYVWFIGD